MQTNANKSNASLVCAKGRRDEDHAVAAHEQHGDGPLLGPTDLLVGVFVDLDGGHRLLHFAEDHVEMLVERLQKKHLVLENANIFSP